MVRGRGWPSTKVGQALGRIGTYRGRINRTVSPVVTQPGTKGKWHPFYRVNLGTKLPTRTMGFSPPIKDTSIKKRNR